MTRRGSTGLSGLLAIDKPSGITSHDVVDAVRRATGERRIGHAGTLDPLATGLLIVLVGPATRLERYLVGHDKRYEARIVLGTTTDTLDAEGTIIARAEVSDVLFDPETAQAILRTFLGQSEQMPPAYSAIKKDGVPAYRLARQGVTPDLQPRPIEVSEARLRGVDASAGWWDAVFTVSSGTYIRSLARDVGLAAGTVGHLGSLRRTRIGALDVASAVPLEQAVRTIQAGGFESLIVDPLPLLEMPAVEVSPEQTRDGRLVPVTSAVPAEGARGALVTDETLLGVYVRSGDVLRPETVLTPGVCR